MGILVTDPQPLSPLAARALARLRKLAVGNGLDSTDVAVIDANEQNFVLTGKMEVSPLCETQSASYPGGIRSKEHRQVAAFAALQEAVAQHQKTFNESPDWAPATAQELKTDEGQGWGLEDAKVTLPEKSATYAATETCPTCGGRKNLTCTQCAGRGTVICTQCQGQGREQCYYCGGRGENPHQPQQTCPTCNGTRYAPCRFCQTRGNLPCPTCQGKRGTPCPSCQSSGVLTQEVTVTCGAETHFTLKAEGLPSGLRRGLDRIGIANLSKGHADITALPPTKEEKELPQKGNRILILNYRAVLPYAEIRMGLGKRKTQIAAIGKRCALVDVPAFLDEPLKPWRDKLHLAAEGKAPLETALEARALKEILSLTLAGKGNVKEVRKLYPFGLSPEIIASLLTDTGRALKKTTLNTRTACAVACVAVCLGLFYKLYTTGLFPWVTMGWGRLASFAGDSTVLAFALGTSWLVLNLSTRFVLRRRFPHFTFALQQKIGKIGLSMLGCIAVAFVLFIRLSPLTPVWLAAFIR